MGFSHAAAAVSPAFEWVVAVPAVVALLTW